jgi:uncharacterized membrane protein
MFLDSTASDSGSVGGSIVILIIGAFFYVVPIIVAASRHTINKGAVSVVTILLGWTVLGWIIALAMAAGGTTEQQLAARSVPAAAPMPAMPVISPDGKSWWNGKEWVPLPPAGTQAREVRPLSPPE